MAKTNAERQNLFRKKVAKRLHAANKLLDAQAKLCQAYEELAHAHGFKDWNTAAAWLYEIDFQKINALLEQKEEQYVQQKR